MSKESQQSSPLLEHCRLVLPSDENKNTSQEVLPPGIDPSVVALCRNRDAKRFDLRRGDGISPADMGEHQPIPDEAVSVLSIGTELLNLDKE